MTLVQRHFRGRFDQADLNFPRFDFGIDQNWTQEVGRTFRIRFEIEETGVSAGAVGGQLEANLNDGIWQSVTTASTIVAAAGSEHFDDGDVTTDVLSGSTRAFTAGSGSTDGLATAVTLEDSHTELEYAIRILRADVASGNTVGLRIAGLDTYIATPSLIISDFTLKDKVRLKIGDTDALDPLLSDDEINAHIAAWPTNVDLAAANAAEAIAGKFAREFNFSEDGQSFSRRERFFQYRDLAKELRRRAGLYSVPITR